MKTKFINKSIFLAGSVCQTKGWYCYHDFQKSQSTTGEQLRMDEGKQIGELARQLYPEGILITERDVLLATKETSNIIKNEKITALFEASFTNGEYATRADILVRFGKGWHLIEVKSSNDFSNQKNPKKDEYIQDMAYTLMVIGNSIAIEKVSILSLSKSFRLGMSLGMLFMSPCDVTNLVKAKATEFEQYKSKLAALIVSSDMPKPEWKYACKPCGFFKTECLGKNVKNPIFELPDIREKRCLELFNSQCYEIDLISKKFELSEKQKIVRETSLNNKPYCSNELLDKLNTIQWPVYYLDFETIKTAYPLYADVAPHEQIITQYSLHKLDSFNSKTEHYEYLANPKQDCRHEVAKNLINHLSNTGSIIVYSHFEKDRLNGLKNRFPNFASAIESIIERLVDLQAIIKNHYYHPEFHGSYSIKQVLPVLVPTMTYKNLAINNGDMAIAAFVKMAKEELSDDQLLTLRQQLLEYCRQDTMAMLALHKWLASIVGII